MTVMDKIVSKVVGSANDRYLKGISSTVVRVNELEPRMEKLSDIELREKTEEFKNRLGTGESLEDILPEAFAVVREAARRTVAMRPFDVQVIGAIVLHEGKIAEMKTGEGKTLVAAMPIYLNALTGKGAHVITVNDYLASRDAEWMGRIYRMLGLSVGVIVHDMDDAQRKVSYNCDVTYGTNNEFGFDYLRDNMKYSLSDYVQRDLHYAIVDEVDSILIDEARTPLIISGPTEESTEKYYEINSVIPKLKGPSKAELVDVNVEDKEKKKELEEKYDYIIEEKSRTVSLTDKGVLKMQQALGIPNLYDASQMETLHHVQQGLKAHTLFTRDVDYVVKEGQVIIVDEFTGRLMPGRRFSDGLHQALEAKENVHIENENQTLASITFQNYFRMYDKLAGMTGTAFTEAGEFAEIYNLDVAVIPTNMPMIRADNPDVIYKTEKEKYSAAIEEIKDCYERGQPVLVGTISIEKSELLSRMLKRKGIPHHVLNAKHHEREAEIVSQAGRKGAVTLSTNMAGRGTDIVLGGNPEMIAKTRAREDEDKYLEILEEARITCAHERDDVVSAGGLHILGTERHESRRIDNQLRGRSGRQGDPGSSRFYLSLEDDLLRIFGSDRISGWMDRLGMGDGEPIEHKWVSKAVETAQTRVESQNFEIRKHLLEYDDVMNQQRSIIYRKRRQVLESGEVSSEIDSMIQDLAEDIVFRNIDEKAKPEEWNLEDVEEALFVQFGFRLGAENMKNGFKDLGQLADFVAEKTREKYEAKAGEIDREMFKRVETDIFLLTLDQLWKDHLLNMDHLKEGIGLRGYGQQDPLVVYKREAFQMFETMWATLQEDVMSRLMKIQLVEQEPPREIRRRRKQKMVMARGEEPPQKAKPMKREGPRVGRNDPCPCGSGKKYKKCCGA